MAADAARAAIEEDDTDILGAIEMLGVQEVSSDQVVLRLTVKTKPNGQWAVQRRLRRAILQAFVENSIDLPYSRVWGVDDGDGRNLAVSAGRVARAHEACPRGIEVERENPPGRSRGVFSLYLRCPRGGT